MSASGIRSASMDCSPTIQGEASAWLVIIAAVVAPDEPIAAAGRNIFLVETIASSAKPCLPIAVQMFKMQLNHVRTVEIGREIMTGMGIAAHVDDGISHFRRQALDMVRIPGIVVPNLASASDRGSIGKTKKHNCSGDCRMSCANSPHASLPSRWKTMHLERRIVSGTRTAASDDELTKTMLRSKIDQVRLSQFWVKRRNTRSEQMFSALPPKDGIIGRPSLWIAEDFGCCASG